MKVQHRRKVTDTPDAARAWIDRLPKKARTEGIIEIATDAATGRTVVSASWESRSFNHRLYRRSHAWDVMLPDECFTSGEPVKVADLKVGDRFSRSFGRDVTLADAMTVAEVLPDGVRVEFGYVVPHREPRHAYSTSRSYRVVEDVTVHRFHPRPVAA